MRDHNGQFGLADFFLFTIIILMASSVWIFAAGQTQHATSIQEDFMLAERALDTLMVLLRTTLDTGEFWNDITINHRICVGWRPVCEIIGEYLYLRSSGIETDGFDHRPLIENLLVILLNLTSPDLGSVFLAELEGSILKLTPKTQQEQQKEDLGIAFAECKSCLMIDREELTVHFSLGLWRL